MTSRTCASWEFPYYVGDPPPEDGSTRRSSAMNIASVPWRCGHSCTAPGEVGRLRVGRLRNQRHDVLQTGVGPVRQDWPDDPGRLLDNGRAGGVEDHAAGPDRVEGAAQQRLLQRHQGAEVVAGTPPAALRPAAQRPQASARCIDEHPVEHALCPRRPGAVTDDESPRVARRAVATSLARCGWRSLASSRAPFSVARAASRAAFPPGPAHRSSQRSSGPQPSRARVRGRPAVTRRPGPRLARRGRPGSRRGRPTRG